MRASYALLAIALLSSGAVRAFAADVRAIAQRNEPGVLVILGQRSESGADVQSSGGCVAPSGLVLTTAHQVDGVENLRGRLPDGREVALQVVELDRDRELALLQADRPLPVALPLGDSRQLASGAPLVCIATPENLAFTTVTGIVSNTNRTYRGYPVIQTDFRVSPGSSGGPVFDEHGLLVGVVIGKLADQEWVTVVNPLENAEALLARHGVRVRGGTAATEEAYELVPAPGISEGDLRAIEAYNRGTRARMPQDKAQAYALAARLLPDFFEAWFNLTLAREAIGDLAGAMDAATRAVALSEAHPGALRNLGRLRLAKGDLPGAEQAFAAALSSGPESARALSELGEVHRRQGRLDEARAGFEAALRLEPGYALAQYNLALTLAQQGARAEAVDAFEAYLRLRPDAADRAQVLETIERLRNPSKE